LAADVMALPPTKKWMPADFDRRRVRVGDAAEGDGVEMHRAAREQIFCRARNHLTAHSPAFIQRFV